MSRKSADWLYSQSVNRLLGIACIVSVGYTVARLAANHAGSSSFVSTFAGGEGLFSPIAVLGLVGVSQLFLLVVMIVHTLRHPRWNAVVKTIAVLGSFMSFVSAGSYIFSYRPSANFRATGTML